MDVEQTSIEPAADVADTAPTTDAELTSTMGEIYDAHHSEESEPSGYVEHEPDSTESFADTEQPTVETPQGPAALPMPRSWAKEQAAVWNQLSPEAQNYIALRDDQQHRKITELGRKAAQAHGEVGAVYEHYRNQGLVPIGDDGASELTPPQIVEHALEFDRALRQSPAPVIAALANAHGIDLAELAGVQGHQHADLEQWQQAFGTVQQQLEQIKTDYAQQQQREYHARAQWLAGELDSYTAGKEYWPKIEDEVIAQVQALVSQNRARTQDPMALLKEAEQRALKLSGIDPDAGTKQAQKAAEQKKKADEAKRLASLNAKSRSGHSPSESKDIWQTMADVYDRRNS